MRPAIPDDRLAAVRRPFRRAWTGVRSARPSTLREGFLTIWTTHLLPARTHSEPAPP